MKPENKIAILIPSCDNYSDIWMILSESYKRFWKDCPYNKYIITNSDIQVPDIFTSINVGEDKDWSSNCIDAIKKIQEDYILLHIDDLILIDTVKQENIDTYSKEFFLSKGNYLKLLNNGSSTKNKSKLLVKTYTEAPYRTSTVFSLWKKEVLLDLLKSGENPWQFEIEGTKRSMMYSNWYSSSENCFTFENLVIKRVLELGALKRLSKIGLGYTGNRKKMSVKSRYIYNLKGFVFRCILRLPNRISNNLVKIARKIG